MPWLESGEGSDYVDRSILAKSRAVIGSDEIPRYRSHHHPARLTGCEHDHVSGTPTEPSYRQVTLTASWPPNLYQAVWRAVTPEHIRLSEFQFPTVMSRNPRVGGCNFASCDLVGLARRSAGRIVVTVRPLARRYDLGRKASSSSHLSYNNP